VNVSGTAAASVTNTAVVSGGGETITANDTASDVTTVNQLPDLTIRGTHIGNFTQGQIGAVYAITVSNAGGSPTGGVVSVTDNLPASLTATAMSGTGWTCSLVLLTCTRSDVLNTGASYPAITLTVNVSGTAATSVTNAAVVSGGGETITANDTASDVTTVGITPPAFSIAASPVTLNVKAGQKATYTVTLTPLNNVPFSNTVALSVTGLPAKSSFVFNPSSVTPGALPATATFIVSTTTGGSFLASNSERNRLFHSAVWVGFFGLVLSGSGLRRRAGKSGKAAFVALALIFVGCGFGLYGCGSASHSFQNLGTLPGTYIVTVTGTSGSTTQSGTVTLTVQP
jgi:uncharacterized repeat protein (TIGR01451 family)